MAGTPEVHLEDQIEAAIVQAIRMRAVNVVVTDDLVCLQVRVRTQQEYEQAIEAVRPLLGHRTLNDADLIVATQPHDLT